MSNKKPGNLFAYNAKGDLEGKEVINCKDLISKIYSKASETPLKEIVLEGITEDGYLARIIIPNKEDGQIKVMIPLKFNL